MDNISKTKVVNWIAKEGSYDKKELKKMKLDELLAMIPSQYHSKLYKKSSSAPKAPKVKAPKEKMNQYSLTKLRTYVKNMGVDVAGLKKKNLLEFVPLEDRTKVLIKKGKSYDQQVSRKEMAPKAPKVKAPKTPKVKPPKAPKAPKEKMNQYSLTKLRTYAKKIGLDVAGLKKKDLLEFVPLEDRIKVLLKKGKSYDQQVSRMKIAQIKKMDNEFLGNDLARTPINTDAISRIQGAIRRKPAQEFYGRFIQNVRKNSRGVMV